MYINNEHISKYGAKLLDYTVGGGSLENNYFANGPMIKLFSQKPGCKKLTITLTFEAADRRDTTRQVSRLTALFQGQNELLLPDRFYYTSILEGIGDTTQLMPTWFEVPFSFLCIQHDELQTVTMTSPGNYYAGGTMETGCIWEIISTVARTNFKINGITIKRLVANRPFIIDGIHSKVIEDSGNAFQQTDLIDFPKTVPGKNAMTWSHAATVLVKFYPTYI